MGRLRISPAVEVDATTEEAPKRRTLEPPGALKVERPKVEPPQVERPKVEPPQVERPQVEPPAETWTSRLVSAFAAKPPVPPAASPTAPYPPMPGVTGAPPVAARAGGPTQLKTSKPKRVLNHKDQSTFKPTIDSEETKAKQKGTDKERRNKAREELLCGMRAIPKEDDISDDDRDVMETGETTEDLLNKIEALKSKL